MNTNPTLQTKLYGLNKIFTEMTSLLKGDVPRGTTVIIEL